MKKIITLGLTLALIFGMNFLAYAESIKELYDQAGKLFSDENFEEAIKLYEDIVSQNPNFAEVYNKLGLAYRELNMNLEEVSWYFKVAIEIKPNFTEAYINLAKAYYGLGRFDEAEKSCLKALSIQPNMLSAELALAWTYLLGQQKPSEAITYFQKVAQKTKVPSAYYGLGLAYFMSGQRPLVLEVITTLRSIDQENLAKQLEDIVRTNYFEPTEVGPLANQMPQERQKGVIVSTGAPKGIIEENPQESGSSPIQGMTKIRMKGKMINIKTPTTSDSSNLQIKGTPSVTSSPELRIRQMREFQRKVIQSPQ